MPPLSQVVDAIAEETGFAGVVCVDQDGRPELVRAYGFAHRGYQVANTPDTRFAVASGSKGLTALAVVSLVEQGALRLSTRVRSVLGGDLPLIGDTVTVEHLLAHRSGIGDYLDEAATPDITEYVLTVPAQDLLTTEQYLAVLDGHPAKSAPDETFAYCNGGYVVLALVAERVSGTAFHDLVAQRVCAPAGMTDSAYLRSDELPGRTAVGYLPLPGVSRTNVFHLPVRGSGDGGLYSTVADISLFWRSLFAGKIVSTRWVAEMVRPRSEVPAESKRYGLGFWLHRSSEVVMLEGYDAGVSFRTMHDPGSSRTYTVVSNSSDGAWPIVRHLETLLPE
jgi:CubicO group peptidase (beta-lactamase class C family)